MLLLAGESKSRTRRLCFRLSFLCCCQKRTVLKVESANSLQTIAKIRGRTSRILILTRSTQMEASLTRELAEIANDTEGFVKEFSEEDYQYITSGWQV